MEIIAIIFIVISVAIVLFFGFKHLNKKIQQKYTLIDAYNHQIDELRKDYEVYNHTFLALKEDIQKIEIQKEEARKSLQIVQDLANHVDEQKNHYNEELKLYKQEQQQKLDELRQEWENLDNTLCDSYAKKQTELMEEMEKVKERIAVLQATQDAINERSRENRESSDFLEKHSLLLDSASLRDVDLLRSIKDKLTNPVAINKIIWSTYFQPLAKVKFPMIIGKPTCCGIYKITDVLTDEVYIGQARDVCERWKEHCKAGLEVNPAPANKLYRSIIRDGLNNFTFEVLEECDISLLNEKEKFYIDFFKSYDFGLNSTRGNN